MRLFEKEVTDDNSKKKKAHEKLFGIFAAILTMQYTDAKMIGKWIIHERIIASM